MLIKVRLSHSAGGPSVNTGNLQSTEYNRTKRFLSIVSFGPNRRRLSLICGKLNSKFVTVSDVYRCTVV